MRELRRAGDRFLTEVDGITTWHSFSHGVHYDPSNVGFGPLVAINVEHVAPGAGYDHHRHADVEIVTWVVDGVLAHADTVGNDGQVRPGTAQRLSAGTGVEHAERNASDEPLVFVQTVLRSTHDREPRYASVEVAGDGLLPGVDVAGPARMLVARPAGTAVEVPAATRTLVHVTRGSIVVGDERLSVGDELRTDEPVGAVDGSGEALVWLLDNAP